MIVKLILCLNSVLNLVAAFDLKAPVYAQNARKEKATCHLNRYEVSQCMPDLSLASHDNDSHGDTAIIYDKIRKEEEFTVVCNFDTEQSTQIFLKFSPLVGVPSIIPIHVEVMILNSINKRSTMNDMNTNGSDGIWPSFRCLHRIDFLPAEPTKESTILKLITLQSVPGLIRHRILISSDHDDGDANSFKISTGNNKKDEGEKHYSIVQKERIDAIIGKKRFLDDTGVFDHHNERNDMKIDNSSSLNFVFEISNVGNTQVNCEAGNSIPIQIPEKIQILLEERKGKDLHLLFYNCYSFSLDVLKALKL